MFSGRTIHVVLIGKIPILPQCLATVAGFLDYGNMLTTQHALEYNANMHWNTMQRFEIYI